MEGNVLERFGRAFIPRKIRPGLRAYILKTGMNKVPYAFFGALFLVSAVFAVIMFVLYVNPLFIQGKHPLLGLLFSFIGWIILQGGFIAGIILFIVSALSVKVYRRTKEMENALPDYLSLVITNLRGGMSFEKSLWGAIKPEFGVLSEEITIVSKKVMTGNDATDALVEFSMKYESPILRRAMDLIIGELRTGGRVAEVIEKIVDDMVKSRELHAEMSASVITYMIFIGVIVMAIAPVLFALAFHLLNIVLDFASSLGSQLNNTAMGISINISRDAVNTNYFKWFSMLALGVIAVFSSMIVSIIEKGNIKEGLKYIPMFLISSELVYIIVMFALGSILSGVIKV